MARGRGHYLPTAGGAARLVTFLADRPRRPRRMPALLVVGVEGRGPALVTDEASGLVHNRL